MLKRLLIALAVTATVVAVPTAAHAADKILFGQNTYGQYDCQLKISSDKTKFTELCNIFDQECDGYGVYVQRRITVVAPSGLQSVSGWSRRTPNAGGCGNGKYGYDRTDTATWGWKFDSVKYRMCKDVWGTDPCWSATEDYWDIPPA